MHEPGEAYFATFADRVNARIAGARGAAAPAPRGLRWWQSPRRLALAGTVTAVIAGAGIVLMTARQVQVPVAERDASLVARARQVEGRGESGSGALAKESRRASPEAAAPASGDIAAQTPSSAPGAAASEPSPPVSALQPRREAPGTRMLEVPRGTRREERAAPAPGFATAPKAAPGNATPAEKMRELKRASLMSSGEKARQNEVAEENSKRLADEPARDVIPGPSPPVRATVAPGGPAQAAAPPLVALDKAEPHPFGVMRRDGTRAVCGTVSDDRGRPLAGASISATDGARTAVSGADGRFCLELPPGEHTLQLLAVGFRAARLTVPAQGGADDLVATLQPVAVLGGGGLTGAGRAGLATRGLAEGTVSGAAKAGGSLAEPALSRGAAGLSALPESIRVAAAEAARDQAGAFGIPGPGGFVRAAKEWEALLPRAGGGAAELEVRARIAECRYFAWRRGGTAVAGARSPRDRDGALTALESFIARAAPGERRERAVRWREEVRGR